jgi:hypothetical protein
MLIPRPSHSSRFDHPNTIGLGVEIIKPTFLLQCQRLSFTPIHNNRQNYSSVYIFKFLDSKLEAKDSAPNGNRHSLTLICSQFLHEYNFDLLKLPPNISKQLLSIFMS